MGDFVWHAHHEVDWPLEYLEMGLEDRLTQIMFLKPPKELGVRMLFIGKVKSNLPEDLTQAIIEWRWSCITSDRSRADFIKRVRLNKKVLRLLGKYKSEIMAAHKEECGCNWTEDNRNIFNLVKPDVKGELCSS